MSSLHIEGAPPLRNRRPPPCVPATRPHAVWAETLHELRPRTQTDDGFAGERTAVPVVQIAEGGRDGSDSFYLRRPDEPALALALVLAQAAATHVGAADRSRITARLRFCRMAAALTPAARAAAASLTAPAVR